MSKKAIENKKESVSDTISDKKVNNLEVPEGNQSSKSDRTKEPKAEKSLIKAGLRVKVKAGSKTYSGVQIANFVYNNMWIVKEVDGNRVVIDKDTAGKYSILTSIHKDNLILA